MVAGAMPTESYDDFGDDLEQFDEEWKKVDEQATRVLREALADLRGAALRRDVFAEAASNLRNGLRDPSEPFAWVGRAAGFETDRLPDDDRELLLRCTAATISPREPPDLDIDEESILFSLDHADWLGAIVTAVRSGPGADASPDALADGVRTCPEVELPTGYDSDDQAYLGAAFSIIALPWHVLGLIDEDQRLTPLGAWVLPRALASARGADFDASDD